MRVLIADKDSAARNNLKNMVSQRGCMVVGEAEDGMTAIRLTQSLHPDLVLISSNLNVLSGLETAKAIEESRVAAVVLILASANKEMVRHINERCSFPVLIRPVEEYLVLSTMEYAYTVFHRINSLENEVRRLKGDLDARKTVERAKGILMKTHGLSEDEAFRKIQQQSMKKRTSMKEIAKAIVTTYELQTDT